MEDYRLCAKLLRQLTDFTSLPPISHQDNQGLRAFPTGSQPLPVRKPVLSPLIKKRSSLFSIIIVCILMKACLQRKLFE
jgi:hypothetical protein